MTAPLRFRAPAGGGRTVVAVFVAIAIAVGGLVTVKPTLGIALVGAAIVVLVVALDVSSLPYFLVFTMFIESVSLGPGLRVGRVAGAMAILVLALSLLTRGRAGLRASALLCIAGSYGLWIVASSEWAWSASTVPADAFSYLLSASYALTFAVLVRRREQLFGIAKVLALGSTVFGLVAFAYYVRHIGSAETVDQAAGARAAGLQGDPNYFAIFQVIALPPALVLAATERTKRRFLYYGAVGVIVISVVSSLSRTGLIALTVAVLLTLLFPWRIFFSAASQKLTYLLSIVLSAAVAGLVGSSALVQRVQTILNPNAQGSYRGAGRQDLWRAALHGWRQSNELIGLGAGNFKLYSLDFLQSTPGVDTSQNYAQTSREVHNAYLENLTDLGVIGLAIFVLVLVLCGRSLLRSFRRARAAGDLDLQRFSLAFLVSLVGYSLSAIFLSNQLAKALWILVGLALALDVMTRRWQPLLATARPYDPAVGTSSDDREHTLEQGLRSLVIDQERFDGRRAALDERERELAQRERAFTERERALQAQPAPVDGAAAAARVAEFEEARKEAGRLAAQVAALEKLLGARDRTVQRLQEQLAAVPEPPVEEPVAVEAPAVEEPLAVEAPPARPPLAEAPPPTEPEPEPEPPPEPSLDLAGVLEVAPGQWSLDGLQNAASQFREDPRSDEWLTYATFLREHADMTGVLPATFDPLVWEVYGDLIARVRGT